MNRSGGESLYRGAGLQAGLGARGAGLGWLGWARWESLGKSGSWECYLGKKFMRIRKVEER